MDEPKPVEGETPRERGLRKEIEKLRAERKDNALGEKITLDDLAAMMQREFTQTRADMSTEFKQVHARFDHIEKILLAKQEARIEKLEREVKELRNALAM